MARMTYFFSMLQFVPDPARGEYVNIGAIAGDDEAGDWELRQVMNLRRASSLDDVDALPIALSFLAELEDRVQAVEDPDSTARAPICVADLETLAADMNNVVQLTAPARLDAESAAEGLDFVFKHKVLDPAARKRAYAHKSRAVGATRRGYRESEVPREAIVERAELRSERYHDRFDFAVHNGSVVQLAHCWSFETPSQSDLADQVKSWAWMVHELRQGGGELKANGTTIEIPKDADVAAVCILPGPETEHRAYEEAVAAFDETDVDSVDFDHASEVGARAAQLLAND